MHKENSFITLTYNEENLGDKKLNYRDIQLFLKKLRKTTNNKISYFVTGEYGDHTKRKHWHILTFNYRPSDCTHFYTTKRGDKIYQSKNLDKLWGYGYAQIGDITLESAGYCARYAAKKLNHGKDQDHDFKPISKKSCNPAIGRTWLEKYWQDAFNHGYIIIQNKDKTQKLKIPRYFEKWLKNPKNGKTAEWEKYVTRTKQEKSEKARDKSEAENKEYKENVIQRGPQKALPLTKSQIEKQILKEKFNQLKQSEKL